MGCSQQKGLDYDLDPKDNTGRWYSQSQVDQGRILYKQYCAACHGTEAEATPNWKTSDDNGNFPPPPLNGTAHAWHHPIEILAGTIEEGGVPLGGTMPAFGKALNDDQKLAIIASFQHYWSEPIYEKWLKLEKNYQKNK